MSKNLDDIAKLAIEKHQRLLYSKVLELVLGEMIAIDGISHTRDRLLWYYNHLAEFDNGINNSNE